MSLEHGTSIRQASDPARMAIGMSLAGDNLLVAAQSVGLPQTDLAELEELARLARERHPGLIARKTAATSELIQQTIALAALRLRDSIQTLAPAQVALVLRQAVQALELYQGGSQAAYTQINLQWPGLGDAIGGVIDAASAAKAGAARAVQ